MSYSNVQLIVNHVQLPKKLVDEHINRFYRSIP